MINNEWYAKLSEETKVRLKACKTEDELNRLCREEGIELDQDVLDAVAGGFPSVTKCRPRYTKNSEQERRP